MNDKYSSIIDIPYKKSNRRPHMSVSNRSAQFAPFAALTGFDDSIIESGKIYVDKIKISEDKVLEINKILNKLLSHKNKLVKITYYESIKDNKGQYKNIISNVIDVDSINKIIILEDKKNIKFHDIYSLSII